MTRLPNCFIVGAPKAGTTSLYHYLAQHPDIFMSPIKEPNYFAEEVRAETFDPQYRRRMARESTRLHDVLSRSRDDRQFGGIVADWNTYLRLFANAGNETTLGEASACYLWSPTAARGIAKTIAEAKILVMLRDPSDRAFSQYLHGLGNGTIRCTFREHIHRNRRHVSGQFCAHYPFLEFGLYSEQLRRYRERFGSNVHVEFYEDFKSRPREVLRNICSFLGVASEFSPDMGRQHLEAQVPRRAIIGWFRRTGLWGKVARLTPARLRPFIRRGLMHRPGVIRMDPADREFLVDFYRDDISKLAVLLDRNLDSWLR